MTMKQLLKDIARWFFWSPFRKTIYVFPLTLIYAFAGLIGRVSYYLMKGKRNLMREEFLNIYGGESADFDVEKIIREGFSVIAKEKMEILLFPRMNAPMIRRISSIDGAEHLDRALAENKGVMLLISHFGNQRFVMPALGFREYKVNQIAAPPTVWKKIDKRMSKLKEKALECELECEQSLPVKFIYYDRFLREALECLKRNEILVIAGDSVGGDKKIEAEFLNRTALLSPGPLGIARKAGSPILPVFIIRNKDNTQTVKIEKQLKTIHTGDKKRDDMANLQQYLNVLEHYVKMHPSHYLKHLWWVQSRKYIDPVPMFKLSDTETENTSNKLSEVRP
jgi:KDO2-lipid IV(A) lauroyltransferase